MVTLLQHAGTRWSAATTSAMSAAPLQLAAGTPVMAIGGFTGSDPAPTPAQFQQDVAAGEIHYYVAGGGRIGGAPGTAAGGAGGPAVAGGRGSGAGQGVSAEISSWVTGHLTAMNVDGKTVYDLTRHTA